MKLDGLDPLIHVPARLQIVATLAALPDGDALTFKRLQTMIELTARQPDHAPAQARGRGLPDTEKTGSGPASQTTVALTHSGRAALDTYAQTLRGLLDGI